MIGEGTGGDEITIRARVIVSQGGRAANQWVLPHRCQLKIVKKSTIFAVSSTDITFRVVLR